LPPNLTSQIAYRKLPARSNRKSVGPQPKTNPKRIKRGASGKAEATYEGKRKSQLASCDQAERSSGKAEATVPFWLVVAEKPSRGESACFQA